MITLRYPKSQQTQELDELLYHAMEDCDFEVYEPFEEDYMVDNSTEVVGQFEGDFKDFKECRLLLLELEDFCPDIKYSDEDPR